MNEDYTRKWEKIDNDVMVKIFQGFDIFELTSGLAHVCSWWRNAACDALLWKTLDLSLLKSDYVIITVPPYVYVNTRSDKQLTKLLKISLNLSRGSVTKLIFHFYQYVNDDQLTYIAKRCPKLKRLVLPAWNRITKRGIFETIGSWKDLESLTIGSIDNPLYLMEAINLHCKKLSQLKIMGQCNQFLAETIICYIPNLKVLSLRCSIVHINDLIRILYGLKNLEVLNISHCLIDGCHPTRTSYVTRKVPDELLLMKGLRLRELLTCTDEHCGMCRKMKADKGVLRWYKYEEGLWKDDEVKSLAV